jgi:ubiquinone/menaquinone biosynthesis C-methylase UbiE
MPTPAEAWRGYKPESFALLEVVDGDQVLDVGCGTGEDARTLCRVARGVAVLGVDQSEAKIAEAERLTLGLPRAVDFRVGDAARLPLEDGTFDACRADKVFHHLDVPAKALAEMVRVARPSARIVVSDVDYDTLLVDAPDVPLTRRIVGHHADRMPSGRIGRQLPALFGWARLKDIGVFPYTAIVTADDEETLRLREKADRAREDGVISAEDAARWVAALEVADRAGRFFCALTLFTVRGRKP